MPKFVTCGPNEAIIVSGCCHSTPTIRAGGRVFVWPAFHRVQRISLNTMTLNVESPKVYSAGGVPVTVRGVAQVKIQGKDLSSLKAASEMFLDKTEEEIMDVAKATLDGHQRSIIAAMEIEDIYKKRREFSNRVLQSASTDLVDMGLALVSYTVQDISDDEGYLDALGQEKTMTVRSEARREIAKCNSLTECENLETYQNKKTKEITYEQSVALKQLDFEVEQAKYLKEHFENQAKSEKAGDLQLAKMNQKIAKEELEVILMEKEKETELITKRKELRRLELSDKVEKRADAECEREKKLARAYAEKAKAEAMAEAEKIKKLAKVRAEAITAQKESEAQVLRKRAEAFAEFGNAAKLEMVLAILPRLTAEIAGPIADCKKITSVSQDGSVGFSRITNEILEVVETLCDSVGNITNMPLVTNNSNNGGGGSNSDLISESGSTSGSNPVANIRVSKQAEPSRSIVLMNSNSSPLHPTQSTTEGSLPSNLVTQRSSFGSRLRL